jgi:hypothetical protein
MFIIIRLGKYYLPSDLVSEFNKYYSTLSYPPSTQTFYNNLYDSIYICLLYKNENLGCKLIEYCDDINLKSRCLDCLPLLYFALCHGAFKIAKKIIHDPRCDINIQDDGIDKGNTIIMCLFSKTPAQRMLINHKCNIILENDNGETFFDLSIKNEWHQIVKYYYWKQLK